MMAFVFTPQSYAEILRPARLRDAKTRLANRSEAIAAPIPHILSPPAFCACAAETSGWCSADARSSYGLFSPQVIQILLGDACHHVAYSFAPEIEQECYIIHAPSANMEAHNSFPYAESVGVFLGLLSAAA